MKVFITSILFCFVFTLTGSAQDPVNKKGDVYFTVDEMPKFPGGDQALREFIATNVKYPEKAKKEGKQGKVYVSFIIDKNGTVTNPKVERGVCPELDKESIRVVKSIPQWTPGKEKGKPVKVQFTVPINFALK